MFNEPSVIPKYAGWIDIICNGMFSGLMVDLAQGMTLFSFSGYNLKSLRMPPLVRPD